MLDDSIPPPSKVSPTTGRTYYPPSKAVKRRSMTKKYESAPLILCACGCGQQIKSFSVSGRAVRYVSGHNGRQYSGVDATRTAVGRRWRASNPDKVRDGKRSFYRSRKLRAMEILGNSCRKCGLRYSGTNAPIFEFHHRNPEEKDDGVTRMLARDSWEKVIVELEKCDLLCANCHNMEHGGEW